MNDVNELEETSLHIALGQGHVDVAKLIQNGADVNGDKYEQTALHTASGEVDVAKVLIQNGVDVNAVDNSRLGTSPLLVFLKEMPTLRKC